MSPSAYVAFFHTSKGPTYANMEMVYNVFVCSVEQSGLKTKGMLLIKRLLIGIQYEGGGFIGEKLN